MSFRAPILLALSWSALAAAQPARPTCTQPINDVWSLSPAALRTSVYADPEPQTDSQWEATTVAGNYNTPVFSVNNGPGRAYNRSALNAGTRYFWRARHRNALGWSPWCNEESFRFDDVDPIAPPQAPLATPNSAGGVDFSFLAGSDTTSAVASYNFYETSDAGTLFAWSTTPLSFNRRLGPGTYRWSVRTNDLAGNNSAPTALSSEVTLTADPTLPVLDAPTVTPFASATGAFTVALPDDAGTASFVLMRRYNFGAPANHATVSQGTINQSPGNEGAWQWRIALINGADVGDWSAWSALVYRDSVDPLAPTQVSALPALGAGPVEVRWDAGVDPGAYPSGIWGHALERRGDGGVWSLLATRDAGTGHFDDPPTGRWEYRVTALDAAGNASPVSGSSGQVLVDKRPPSSPGPVVASAAGASVTVSWSPSTDLESGLADYQVSRRAAGGAAFVPVADTASLAVTEDAPAGRWVYRVAARDLAGNESAADADELELEGLPALRAQVACGCGSGGAGVAWVWLALAASVERRRR